MSFTIFYIEKTSLKPIETKNSKSRKTDIFAKGLAHGFGLKIALFPTFLLGNIGQENVFYDVLHRKNAFKAYRNKKFQKSKNWHFSKKVHPLVWSKIGHFSNLFFWDNIGRENVFYDILERKNAFVANKKKRSKSRKTDIFPKGLTNSIGLKLAIFPTFFFWQYRPGKYLLRYSRTKKCLCTI